MMRREGKGREGLAAVPHGLVIVRRNVLLITRPGGLRVCCDGGRGGRLVFFSFSSRLSAAVALLVSRPPSKEKNAPFPLSVVCLFFRVLLCSRHLGPTSGRWPFRAKWQPRVKKKKKPFSFTLGFFLFQKESLAQERARFVSLGR